MSQIEKPIGKVVVPLASASLASGMRDSKGFENQCNYLEDNGIPSVVVLGRTGGLEHAVGADRHTPFYIRKSFMGNMFVCVGDSSKRNQHGYFPAKTLIQNHISTAKMYQADGIVVPTLFYGPEDYDDCPKEDNMVDYFYDVFDMARERDLPVILYNNPAMTGREIPLDRVMEFAKKDIVVAIKDSSGDMKYFDTLIALRDRQGLDLGIYQGSETLASWSMRIGADGIVPSTANLLPNLFLDLVEHPNDGALQEMVNELGKTIYRGESEYSDAYAGLRFALWEAGIHTDPKNFYIQTLTEQEKKAISKVVQEVRDRHEPSNI